MNLMPSFLSAWLGHDTRAAVIAAIDLDISNRLAVRKALRQSRSDAAKRGWQTRRAQA